jgi:hypothetical protein
MSLGRYDNAQKIRSGKLYSSATAHVNIYKGCRSGKISYTTKTLIEGERLDILAGKYYGNGNLWWVIAAASGIGWGIQAPPGTNLRIPTNLAQIEAYV